MQRQRWGQDLAASVRMVNETFPRNMYIKTKGGSEVFTQARLAEGPVQGALGEAWLGGHCE